MKRALLIPLMGVMGVMLSGCGNLATSLNSDQNFDPSTDPLDSPGRRKAASVDAGPQYVPGTFVEVTDSNAGLYRRMPKGNEQPDQRLTVGSQLKVVGGRGSYVKVETEQGQIGFVPAIMVGAPAASSSPVPLVDVDPASIPLESIDPIDPAGLPPLPPPGEEGPGTEIPPFTAPEPEVPPISVEDSPSPGPVAPIVPPDPVEDGNE